jgi:uncharacterized protein (DUF433 family)
MAEGKIVYSEPNKRLRTFVFLGTDVPVLTLLDYLKGGQTLDYFLSRFPDVTRERAVAFLEEAGKATESSEVDYTKKYDTVVSSGQAALRALLP